DGGDGRTAPLSNQLVAAVDDRLNLGHDLLALFAPAGRFGLELLQLFADFSLARAKLGAELGLLALGRLDVAARLLDELSDLLDFGLALPQKLSDLLHLPLGGVRLALGTAARQLLARFLDLAPHRSQLSHQVVPRPLHLGEALARYRQPGPQLVEQFFLF